MEVAGDSLPWEQDEGTPEHYKNHRGGDAEGRPWLPEREDSEAQADDDRNRDDRAADSRKPDRCKGCQRQQDANHKSRQQHRGRADSRGSVQADESNDRQPDEGVDAPAQPVSLQWRIQGSVSVRYAPLR